MQQADELQERRRVARGTGPIVLAEVHEVRTIHERISKLDKALNGGLRSVRRSLAIRTVILAVVAGLSLLASVYLAGRVAAAETRTEIGGAR